MKYIFGKRGAVELLCEKSQNEMEKTDNLTHHRHMKKEYSFSELPNCYFSVN